MAIQARAEATRDRIIGAAVDLFSREGYGATGLSDVIDQAGVSKGAFYYHFDSKNFLPRIMLQYNRTNDRESRGYLRIG